MNETLLDRNREFAASYDAQTLEKRPLLSMVVLTCADPRVDPAHFLGLRLGDAVVLRNLGGRVTPEIEQALAVLGVMAKQFAQAGSPPLELAIIHHTDCGAEGFADPERRSQLSRASGLDEEKLQALAISNHHSSLADDIERLRESKLVPDALVVSASIYDVKTGVVRQVVNATAIREEVPK